MIIKFLKSNWLIILILGIASFCRLYRIGDYMEFLGDQGRDILIVKDFLKNSNLIFIGPQTSIGNMYLGPFFYYLIAPALLLANFSPIGPAIFIALLGVATAWLIFYVSSKWFSPTVGYISAFLYSISPVAIKYSNFSWNPNIMPFFAILFIYFIGEALIKNKYKYLIFASIAFIFTLNSHYLALILLPPAGLFWLIHLINLIKNKHPNLKQFLLNTLLAVFIFLISLTPQILFDFKHQGQNIQALVKFFTYRETTVNIKPYKAIPEMVPMLSQINSSLFLGTDNKTSLPYSALLFIILIFISIIKVLKIKNTHNQYFLLNITWLFFGLLGLGLYKQHIYPHYFGFLIPSIFILIGYILSILFKLKIFGKVLSVLILVSLSYLCIKSSPILKPANSQLNHAYNLAKSISEQYQDSDGKYNIALLASYNDYRGLAPRYFLENNFPSKNFLDQEKYQEIDTLYIILDDPGRWPKGINTDIWEITVSDQKKVIEEFNSIDNTKIYKLKKIKS